MRQKLLYRGAALGCCMFFLCLCATAQRASFTGLIVDRLTEQPVVGATVRLANGQGGSVTDAEGRFSLAPTGAPDSLVVTISAIGYKNSLPIALYPGSDQMIGMNEDVFNLDAVVVTGQGIDVAKRRLSTNSTTVGAAALERIPVPRLEQMLQSQLPTTQITLSGGQPGSTSFVRTRGVQSAFINSTPIVYVDGIRVDNLNTYARLSLNLSGNLGQGATTSALADLPVENIERIEYINGGAATTLYGSDAANGVIQIFTKRGGQGRTFFGFETQIGTERATTDFYYFDRTADLLHQNGFFQLYRLNASGGNERFGFSASGNMMRSTGTLIFDQNADKRYDVRTALNAQLNDRLRYTASFGFASQRFSRVRNGNAGGYVGLWFAEGAASNNFFPGRNNLDTLSETTYKTIRDFVQKAEELQDNEIALRRFQMAQGLEWKPLRGLSFRGTVGVDFRNSLERGIVTTAYLTHTRATNTQGSINNFERNLQGLTMELVGQYDLRAGHFSFLTTAGTQFFRFDDRQVAFIGQNVRDGALSINLAGLRTADEFQLTNVNYGVYAQENIGFRNRYFFEFGVRGDNNPAFGGNISTQYYPKIGASYIVSDEPGLARVFEGHWLSFLKFRANYGVAGNLPPAFTNLPTIAINGFNNAQAATFGLPGNADQRPERIYTLEVGGELGVLRDRIALTATYFSALTRDALFDFNPAPSTGQSAQRLNIGEIENKGWELSANFGILKTPSWQLSLRLSANTVTNTVLNADAPLFSISGFSANTVQSVVEEGKPVGFLRGRRVTFDAEGAVATQEQQVNLGSTIPTLFGSSGLQLGWRNRLNLFINTDYQQGAVAHSFDKGFRTFYGIPTGDVPDKALQSLGTNRAAILNNFSNLFVESTDFLKIRIIGVSYALPEKWLGKTIKGLDFGFSATNPFNFVRASFDPETTIAGAREQGGATTGGFNYSVFGRPRQFLFSVKAKI